MNKKNLFKHIQKLILPGIGFFLILSCRQFISQPKYQQINAAFLPGKIWYDTDSVPINAHGGGILFHQGIYYWFGEHKTAGPEGNTSLVGINCYSSKDLFNWKNEGIALAAIDDTTSEITKGCIMERPKVLYNKPTNKFVMWFHLELKQQGYKAAKTAVAISSAPTGPYTYLRSFRPNQGQWPYRAPKGLENNKFKHFDEQWTPEWEQAVTDGLYVHRDFKEGFIFMADRWNPGNPIDGRYIWLPLIMEDGRPIIQWHDKWDLSELNVYNKNLN